MNYERAKEYLKSKGQEQLLDYYDELDDEKRCALLDEISKANLSVVENIKKTESGSVGELHTCPAVTLKEIESNRSLYEEAGYAILRKNKIGAVLLAGGQGSRLGFEKPKGMFNIGETRFLSIFEQQMNNIKDVTRVSGVSFPLFIMTSEINHDDIKNFFKDNNYFGYPKDRVFFYIQNTEPSCDFNGKIFLDEKYHISLSPDGNGGWYSSLKNSECGKVIESEGIEWLNVYGVDNVLQRICDPVFIGATVLSGCACSSKVVKKTCAEERVGVLCEQDGKPTIVEYYDMPRELAAMRDSDGELTFRFGVTLNYLFNVERLNATVSEKLPYHLAKKAIAHIENGVKVTPAEPNGYKFEKLVVDMVKLMGSCLAVEVDREKEFAPVKNRMGADSVDTARELLKKNGVNL